MDRETLKSEIAADPELIVDTASVDTQARRAELENIQARTIAYLQEQASIRIMRKQWSGWLLFCIVIIVIFDFLFIYLLGKNKLAFEDERIVFAFITDNLIKIAGLAFIVVNYLFDRNLRLPENTETGK